MLDFLMIATRSTKTAIEIYPKFIVNKSEDLMIRGGDFYAVWVEEKKRWSTDEDDAKQLIDAELKRYERDHALDFDRPTRVLYLWDSESGMIDRWHKYCQKQMRDNYHVLDQKLIFSNDEATKKDYSSKRLNYPLQKGEMPAWDKIISTLYSEEERHKIEWAIGSIVSGESKKLQKFMVFYGASGTGKSTILNVIQKLFDGYYSVFDAKALGSSSNSFALEAFKNNPLVAIQHDGDLSKIEDNTRLNSLVSHELMTVNEKFKSTYSNSFNTFLFMGTNSPVKITEAKSGLLRRLIDVMPSGNRLDTKEYNKLTKQIDFELGAIAFHCQEVYLNNPNAYDSYIPKNMLGASNDFYNFVLDSYPVFKRENHTTLKSAWAMYNDYCNEAKVKYPLSQRPFKEELKNYFNDYVELFTDEDGKKVRHYYSGFRYKQFNPVNVDLSSKREEKDLHLINFQEGIDSAFDIECANFPAQYASLNESPRKNWSKTHTYLKDLDTSKLHYVKVPDNHIVIDFDIPNEKGEKDYEKNLKAASAWPETYAELSKSGKGIHLHYIYDGDPSALSRVYDENIEVKVYKGDASLRRKLTKCNDIPIAHISSGLPLKGEKNMINWEGVKSEKMLRTMIKRNLNKEYHGYTKPSIDYIYHLLEEAKNSGLHYDVTDMRNAVLTFAASSTNNSSYCIKIVNEMPFKSDDISENKVNDEAPIVFYDVEIFPNLFIVNWKYQGKEKPVVRMINPDPIEIEGLMKFRLIGFNCRRYDNHILYARMMGYTNEELFRLSQRIIGQSSNAFFSEAYNISYTDVYDFAAKKQSLKKWEIELGIHHKELGLRWDEPVPEDKWLEVAEYCDNDVIATEAVFDHLKGDWTARNILSDLAGMSVNDTTNSLTTRIIFGKERNPKLVYTDLATGKTDPTGWERDDIITAFQGYEFKDNKNIYRGTDLGKGGYVYAKPGMYTNVALLDIESMHPNSAIAMNVFGEYTQNFKDILDARIAIKHKKYDVARGLFGGKLAIYLDDESTAKDLAQALKIAINSVYGLTSATFANPFRDVRNKNNIVALRGALFMRTLQDEVEKRGFVVAHIKTDSIKIPEASPEIIQFCMEFAEKYGYRFEHEATYEKMCLVNDAVYIAKYPEEHEFKLPTGEKIMTKWTATGTQFQIPYVFKQLFSHDKINFNDMCETKSVTSALYLDMNENLPDVSNLEKELDKRRKQQAENNITADPRISELELEIAGAHNYVFVGKVGQFCPMKPGAGGGLLMREKDGKYNAATGSKGYRWMESEMVKELGLEDSIDKTYYHKLVDDALANISKYGDAEWFMAA